MAKRRKVPKIIKDVAWETFSEWVTPRLSLFRHRERRGVRKGDQLGLQSREAFYLSQLQAIHSPVAELFKLSELAEFAATTETALKFLRTESHFKDIATHAAWQFADHVIDLIFSLSSEKDYSQRRILMEVLVLLPGFDILDNQFIETIWGLEDDIKHESLNKDNYIKLLTCLQRYNDVLTLVWGMIPDNKRRKFAEKVSNVVGSLSEHVGILINIGTESGVVSEDLASWIKNVLDGLGIMNFYASYVVWTPEELP